MKSPVRFLTVVGLLFFLVPLGTWADTGISPPTLFEQGTAFLNAKAYHLALDRFLLAGEKSQDDAEKAEALRWTGETHLRNQQYDLAYHDFLNALRLNPFSNNASEVEFKSAVALVFFKNYSGALEHLQNSEKGISDLNSLCDIYFWEAECYYQMSQYPKALNLYETILRKNPLYPHVQLVTYLVDWCYYQQKDYDNAYEGFHTLASKAKDKDLAKLSSFQVAECEFWMGQYTKSQAAYSQFIKTYPKDTLEVPAYYGWGWSLAKRNKSQQARVLFKKIVTNFPTHPLAPWAAVREGTEDYVDKNNDAARADYEKGLTLCADKSPADFLNYGLGWLDYSDKNYSNAVDEFKKVIAFSPQSPLYWDALYFEAGCQYLVGNYSEAKNIYNQISDPAPHELIQDATYWEGWCDYATTHYDSALNEFLFISQNTENLTQTRGLWGAAEASYQLGQYDTAANYYQSALNKKPDTDLAVRCYSGLGWSEFQLEKFPEAIEAFGKVIEKAPHTPMSMDALLRIADSYYDLHNFQMAATQYQSALAKSTGTQTLDAQEQLGWCAYRQENFNQAVSIWGDLLQKNNTKDRKARLLYWSAWAYFRNKDFKDSQPLFQQVEDQYPQNPLAPEAHLRQGDCFFNLGQFNDSKKIYQSFLTLYPTDSLLPDALYGLQWSDQKLGLKDEATQAAKDFLQKFPNSSFAPSIQYRLADTFFQNQKYKNAIEIYDNLLQKYPHSLEAPKTLFWMATAYSLSGKKINAIADFEDLIQKYPNDPLTLEAQFSLGTLYFNDGKFSDAQDHFTRIFQTSPTNHLASHALFNSAVCDKEMGHDDQSLASFNQLIKTYSTDPLSYNAGLQMGIIYEELKDPDAALKAYAYAMKSPDQNLTAEAAFYHANIYQEQAQYDQAITAFNALITNYPDQDQWVVTAYAKVAECYEAEKNYQKAADTYHQILKYTQVKTFRQATLKRLRALEPFLHHRHKKESARKHLSAPPTPEIP